ncbi:MAG TPA: ATP-binding protein [Firmicutes bacterium]|nr:ATP-binding protein [Bacillota bacterium]
MPETSGWSQDLEARLEKARAFYYKRKSVRDKLLFEKAKAEARLAAVEDEIETLGHVRALLDEVAEYARQQAKRRIESMVTDALQFTFGGDLEFKVSIEELRGRPEARFIVSSTYGGSAAVETDPEEARGGGIVDVISLALRVALLEANRPPIGGPLILDEPAKHVSEEYSMNVAQFLKGLSESFGRQIILVTHNAHLAEAGDIAYQVEIKNGRSVVSRRGG